MQLDRRGDNRDAGMTLTELMIAFTVLTILVTVASVALSSYLNLGNQVISSYGNTEQVLTVATNLQKLIRAQVEPAPTPTTGANANVPSPPFSTVAGSDTGQYVGSTAVGTFSATFYSNVGNAAGPARIVASETANAVVVGPTPDLDLHRDGADSRRQFVPVRRQLRQGLHLHRRLQQPREERPEHPRPREQRHPHHGLRRHAASDQPDLHPDLHLHPPADIDGSEQPRSTGAGFGGHAGTGWLLLAAPTGIEGRQHLPDLRRDPEPQLRLPIPAPETQCRV